MGPASRTAVDWGDESGDTAGEGLDSDVEELEMTPEPVERTGPAPAARPAGSGGLVKLAAVAVVVILVGSGLGAFFLMRPAGENQDETKPPPVPTDILSGADVFLSEVRPAERGYASGTFVEVRVGEGVTNLQNWKLTTFDNDTFLFPSTPVTANPAYLTVNITPGQKTGGELSLDPADELALYEPDGKLADFVRWAGGGPAPPRGGWPGSAPGPYPGQGESLSRLDAGRCDPLAWNASPPSLGEPNILQIEMDGVRQVFWLRSGRNFDASFGIGGSPLTLPAGKPVPRALLREAASHLEYSLKQLRRLGDPFSAKNSGKGSPVLEFWITNRSVYRGMTEYSGRVSLDLGDNHRLNSYLCARQMASLIEIYKWGPATEKDLFLREGMATHEGLKTAAAEMAPAQPVQSTIDQLWTDMRGAGLPNPHDHARNLTRSFITSWTYDADHLVGAWLFYNYTDGKFVQSGLGSSLAQALLFSGKEPVVSLQEQTGHNLTYLFWDWLDWRTTPGSGFRYAAPLSQSSFDLGTAGLDGMTTLQPWTAWIGRFLVNFTGTVEFNLSVDPSSAGALRYILVSARTGASLQKNTLQPGRAATFVVRDLRSMDELVLVVGSGEFYGGASFRVLPMPPAPSALSPPDGSYTNDARPPLAWSLVPGISGYEVQLSWQSTFSSLEFSARLNDTGFRPETPLADGRHFWRVRGWTLLGDPTDWSPAAEIIVDTVPPFAHLRIGDPKYRASGGDTWNITSTTLLGLELNASAADSSPETARYRVDGGEWQNITGEFVIAGRSGPRVLEYYSADTAGNSQPPETVPLVVDDTPPEVKIEVGAPNWSDGTTLFISQSTLITMSAMDSGSGLGSLLYNIDYSDKSVYGGAFNLSGVDGNHAVQATATDNLGNTNTMRIQAFLDTTPPGFSVENLTSGILRLGTHLLWVTASDASGLDGVSYLVDGQLKASSAAAPFEWLWDTAAHPDGTHSVKVVARDKVGNEAYVTISVTTDNTPPATTVTIGNPKYRASGGDPWSVAAKTNFNLTAADPGGISPQLFSWYTVDGAYFEGNDFSLSGKANGPHSITYGSRDLSGNNETPKALSVVLDTSPPVPIFVFPQQDSVLSGPVDILVNETTGKSDVQNCTFYYSTDQINWIELWVDYNGTTQWTAPWDTRTVPNGSYWLKAEMVDFLDNRASQNIMIVVQHG